MLMHRNNRFAWAIFNFVFILALSSNIQPVFAHGGVSADADTCVLSLGPYKVHFTGYVVEGQKTREFCEDIPNTGRVIIVLDFIDDFLRSHEIEVKFAETESLKDDPADQGEIVHSVPKTVYEGGTIKMEMEFDQPGYFVGIVSAEGPSGERYISRFPFGVGQNNWFGSWTFIILTVLVVLSVLLIWRLIRRNNSGDHGFNQ